ncbi:ABC transporter ATP-binding protein [Bhargavaea beijingensis]|uniref:ABC transporter ATP-binding protein n=1 Tax=Bhargavaea beijingensis TaxID=426756 RepID=UPI00222565FE|nr:ABC transporter ATP-binding protein [Bhargavaea beijingensis]MCW1928695.1 ABC transporter ATP-binding protein [Bhargavaea beijingensis]
MFLKINGVQKSFGKDDRREQVLKDISIDVREGEFASLLGPSGCGKSTLLSIVAGLNRPDTGILQLDGHDIVKPGKERGMVFQQSALFPWLTVEENVMFPLKGMPKGEAREIAKKYLRLVQLSQYAGHHPHELSGGMQQRVSIARALAMDPAVLLMDEPFGALDEQTRMRLQRVLEEIWIETKKTIIFVTHSIQEAVRLSDRIIVMGTHPGRILKDIEVTLGRPRESHLKEMAAYEESILEMLKTENDKVEEEERSHAVGY